MELIKEQIWKKGGQKQKLWKKSGKKLITRWVGKKWWEKTEKKLVSKIHKSAYPSGLITSLIKTRFSLIKVIGKSKV